MLGGAWAAKKRENGITSGEVQRQKTEESDRAQTEGAGSREIKGANERNKKGGGEGG